MADAPGPQQQGRMSTNHENRGQNVLFGDFHIEFITMGCVGNQDDIFVNDRNVVEAGMHSGDSVVGPSHVSPLIFIRSGR
jgi:hypothetical protein